MDTPEEGLTKTSQLGLKEKFVNILGRLKPKSPPPGEQLKPLISELPLKQPVVLENSSDRSPSNESKESVQHQNVYIGLEKLYVLEKDESFMEGALRMVAPEVREDFEKRIAAIKAEREELFSKYGIQKLLEKEKARRIEKYGTYLDIKDAKSISKLIIEDHASQLPIVQPGYIRMYRGEGPHPGKIENEDEQWTVGQWFGHELLVATAYPLGPLGNAHFIYVDIPKIDLGKYHVQGMPEFLGASKGGEYLLPRDIIAQSKEFVRFLKADTVSDPWAVTEPHSSSQ